MSDDIREEQYLADIRTAAQGGEGYYDLPPIIRKEFYYTDIITALKSGGGGGGGFTPTDTQLAAMNSGIDSTKVQQISTNETNILTEQQKTTAMSAGGSDYIVVNNVRIYVGATEPTGTIPEGSLWLNSAVI